jgi:hypothetical protein
MGAAGLQSARMYQQQLHVCTAQHLPHGRWVEADGESLELVTIDVLCRFAGVFVRLD